MDEPMRQTDRPRAHGATPQGGIAPRAGFQALEVIRATPSLRVIASESANTAARPHYGDIARELGDGAESPKAPRRFGVGQVVGKKVQEIRGSGHVPGSWRCPR
jgi:hypothetical protein